MKQTKLNWMSPQKSAGEPGGELADEALEVDPEILQESLEEDLHKARRWVPAGTWRRKSGGRQTNEKLGLQSMGYSWRLAVEPTVRRPSASQEGLQRC